MTRRTTAFLLNVLCLAMATTMAVAQTPGSHPMTDQYGHMGIGTITPDKSALLDLSSTSAGFLLPRMTTAQRSALVNPAPGLMIFNTDTKTIEFNIGTSFAPAWDPVVTTSSGSGLYWQLLGNAGTNPAVNFIGTTDAQPLVVRTNNVERLRVASTGEVGIGTTPVASRLLTVAGSAGTSNVRLGSTSGAADASAWTPGATDGFVTADANGDLLKRSAGAAVGSVAWLKTGNGGTFTDGTDNLLGTTSNAALNVIVNGARAMRYEPNVTSPNVIGGFSGNSVTAGAVGAVIGGGGASGNPNVVTDDYGVVSGGYNNRAGDNAGSTTGQSYATVGGGSTNVASSDFSTVGGGIANTASGGASTVGGGQANTASGVYATVGGGRDNTASGLHSTAGGGLGNTASGVHSTAGGGLSNTASGLVSTVSGGLSNTASGDGATVGGGRDNTASGDYSAIPGGRGLTLDTNADRSFGFHANNFGGSRAMSISASDIAVFGNTDLWLANNDNNPSELRFFEAYNTAGAFPNTANYSAFKAQTQTADITYILPDTVGILGDVLQVKSVASGTATLDWAAGSSGWNVIGNSGTTAGTNFLGTIDSTAFEIKVFSSDPTANRGTHRVMRIEPTVVSPNILGGYQGNSVSSGVVGATIAGGGGSDGINTVGSAYGTVSGGRANVATGIFSTISGGDSNSVTNSFGNIAGGRRNSVTGVWGAIGGGNGNTIANTWGTIGGGQSNSVNSNATWGTVGGGQSNTVSNAWGTIGGGQSNSINTGATWGTISGGQNNSIQNTWGTIGGGVSNQVQSSWSTVGGGLDNVITGGGWGTIAGGIHNRAGTGGTVGGGDGNTASGFNSVVAGGEDDSASGSWASLGGGQNNVASGVWSVVSGGERNRATSTWSALVGGQRNLADGVWSFVGGGDRDTTTGTWSGIVSGRLNKTTGAWSFIGSGDANLASGTWSGVVSGERNRADGSWSFVGGGDRDTATGTWSAIVGGNLNKATGTWSFIGSGETNLASGTWAAVVGGQGNKATSSWSGIVGGQNNQTIGSWSSIGGGLNNVADSLSAIPGGQSLKLGGNSFGFNADTVNPTTVTDLSAGAFRSSAYFGNADVLIGNVDGNARDLRLYEPNTSFTYSGTNYTAFQAQAQGSNITYTLPASGASSNGDVLTSTTAGVMSWSDADSIVTANAWGLTGNAGTTAGTNFLGTTDNQAFEIHVDNGGTATEGRRRVLRFEPNGTSANIIGGFNGNSVTSGVVGATIAGGGTNGNPNVVTDDYGVVGGGRNNRAGNNGGTMSDRQYATVGGGYGNIASGDYATVSGGDRNDASGSNATVDGGSINAASGSYSTVGGGNVNAASGSYSTVGGGSNNITSGSAATVGGGTNNIASGFYATVAGGYRNIDSGDYSAISGGLGLTLAPTADRSFGFHANNNVGTRDITISASDVAVFGNTDLWLANNDNNPSELRFFEAYNTAGAFPNTANYTAFKAQTQSGDITYTLPATNGSAGQALTIAASPAPTATSATLEWAAAGGGGSNWSLTGNASTTPGTNFIGTTDNVAFEIRVNNGGAATGGNQRVMRYESGTTSPNIIGGFNGNTITGSSGSVIGGGGSNGAATINTVSGSNFGVIAGGTGNRIVGSTNVIIGAGLNDSITTSNYSVIGGGNANSIVGSNSSVIPGGNYLKIGSNSFGFNGLSTAAQTDLSSTGANFTSIAYFGNANVLIGNVDGTAREVRFYEPNTSFNYPGTTNYTGFKAQAQTANVTYTLPAAAPAGAGNGVMTSTAGGTMSWGSHRRVAAVAGTAQVITDAAITGTSTVIVTIEGTVAYGTVTARGAGTFTVTTNAALTTADFINYVILP